MSTAYVTSSTELRALSSEIQRATLAVAIYRMVDGTGFVILRGDTQTKVFEIDFRMGRTKTMLESTMHWLMPENLEVKSFSEGDFSVFCLQISKDITVVAVVRGTMEDAREVAAATSRVLR